MYMIPVLVDDMTAASAYSLLLPLTILSFVLTSGSVTEDLEEKVAAHEAQALMRAAWGP